MHDLTEAIRANRERFVQQLRGDAPVGWDFVVLTAAHERQAAAYRRELDRYQHAGWLPAAEYLVLPDPEGRHLGSGGAAAYALRAIAEAWTRSGAEAAVGFPRLLLINSGGDSKRLPHCATFGKAFAGLPFPLFPGGPRSTAFTELLVSVCGLPTRLGPGVVVLSGDVLLGFDADQFSPGPGVTGLACLAPWELAARHGVYLCPPGGGAVQGFLQKPTYQQMQQAGALVGDQAFLDTGLLAFDETATRRLAALAGVAWTDDGATFGPGALDQPGADSAQIDLYSEICLTLAGSPPADGAALPEGTRRVRAQVLQTLQGLEFWVSAPHPASFVHLGTTREWLRFSTGQEPASRLYAPDLPPVCDQDNLLGELRATPPAAVEYCRLPCLEVGAETVVSGVEDAAGLTLPDRTALCLVPLVPDAADETAWVAQIYGLDDDPKAPCASRAATWLGASWTQWLTSRGLSPEALWPDTPPESRCLWNAQLFVPGEPATTLSWAQWLLSPAAPEELQEWLALPRLSFETSLARSDPERTQAYRAQLAGRRVGNDLVRLLATDEPASPRFAALGSAVELAETLTTVLRHLESETSPFRRARGFQILSDLLSDARVQRLLQPLAGTSEAVVAEIRDLLFRFTRRRFATPFVAARWLEDEAFAEVSAAVAAGVPALGASAVPRLTPGAVAAVRAPARVDFGGGWSDTPPFSLECGGAVLNAALTLDGERPIVARSRVLDEPVIELASVDARVEQRIVAATDLMSYGPGDPLALHKAALIMAGLAGSGPGGDLPAFLRECGGGLRLETHINLPQGSGLGTSSIAATALLRCLDLLQDRASSTEELSGRVLYLEQMITTGGGWQDQLGGMVPGLKLLETDPGLEQHPRITPVSLSSATAEELRRRLLVCFVGERRVAKNILRQMMRHYLARVPEVVRILHEIKVLAREMKAALEAGDLDAFGALMARHWDLNKIMDRQTTTAHVESLFAAMGDLAAGAKLVGAGGGGFMEIIARDAEAADALRARLTPLLEPRGGRFYEVEIDQAGMEEVTG